jgi:hypothetical protein
MRATYRALRIVIVRAEAPNTDLPGCDFPIKGTPAAAGSGHIVELTDGAAQAKRTLLGDATQKLIPNFATGIFQASDADKSATANARQPGEVPVITFAILHDDGSDQWA